MSHLLYFHSFDVSRFVDVFGAGNAAYIDELMKTLPSDVDASRARQVVTRAVMNGLDGETLPDGDQAVLDHVVKAALTTKKLGINRKPISPNGVGGPLFDDFEAAFKDAGAAKLFEVLQRGRDYDGTFVLLSPDDVALAAKLLAKVAESDDDGYLTSELLEPFATAAKQRRAIVGIWS